MTRIESRRDVIILGGGIAGATLAYRLVTAGLDVTVLEKESTFEDRVRGEGIMPWGVREAKRAGVFDALFDAGAISMRKLVNYRSESSIARDEANGARLESLVEGTAGAMAIRHPVACSALLSAAEKAGAEVFRGIDRVEIELGEGVQFEAGGARFERAASLIVGADGRGSRVRHSAGVDLAKNRSSHYVAGLLVELADSPIPAEMATCVGDDAYLVYFRQSGDAHRIYLCGHVNDLSRYSGEKGKSRFLHDLPRLPGPDPERWHSARAIGPCAAVRGDDTLARRLAGPGFVLIGDAGGYVSPITGQGLSLALADVNDVAEAVLAAGGSTPDFRRYSIRKPHRLRTVRWGTEVAAALFTDPCSDRDRQIRRFTAMMLTVPNVRAGFEAELTGPHTVDPDDLPWHVIDDLRADV